MEDAPVLSGALSAAPYPQININTDKARAGNAALIEKVIEKLHGKFFREELGQERVL